MSAPNPTADSHVSERDLRASLAEVEVQLLQLRIDLPRILTSQHHEELQSIALEA